MSDQSGVEDAVATVDILVNDAIAALRLALASSNQQGLAILVDPAMGDPILELYRAHGLPVRRLAVPYGDVADEVKPYIVLVADEQTHERFVNETVSVAVRESIIARDKWPAARSVSAWLIMDEQEARTLIHEFRSRATLRDPVQRNRCHLLRFWDPRVMPQLARLVGQPAWTSWMNVTMTWLSVDAWGRMNTHRFIKSADSTHVSTSTRTVSVDALARIAEVNQCMTLSGRLNRSADEQLFEHFNRLLIRAEELGCSRNVDRVTYAVVADSMQLPLETHPRITAMLAQTKCDEESFADLLSVLESEDWNRIRDDLTRTADSRPLSILKQASS
ncbi:DUF4123 domain-containing protein [Massilia sp. YIM B02443]|uniref:DUF4123 domain-containing protein n=1 Tax=Massilia sp. YIM B02443 TaxID=3050127 RepID=UPI0025B72606|nr:DUF4123 domain-containing protein [Massilia sp. YIM B02443]MDN4036422.1 DUF4123 domain-containing protein [Massilia sp. YIM B02443]